MFFFLQILLSWFLTLLVYCDIPTANHVNTSLIGFWHFLLTKKYSRIENGGPKRGDTKQAGFKHASQFEHHDFVSRAATSGKFTQWIVKHLRADKSQKRFSSKLGLPCPAGDLAAWVIKYEWTYKAMFSLTIRRSETVTEQQTHLNEAYNQIKVWLRQNIYRRAEFVDSLKNT